MSFDASKLFQTRPGSLTDGSRAEWMYETSDSTATVYGTGYFAGVMRGSRGTNGAGLSTGDVVQVIHGTTAFTMGVVTASTADQASTSASTGWKAAYNGTLTALSGQ